MDRSVFRPRIPWRLKRRFRNARQRFTRRSRQQPVLPAPAAPDPAPPPPPTPTLELWRRDVRVVHVPVPHRPLSAAAADENLTDLEVEPLAEEAPPYVADRPAYIASVVQGWIAARECYLVTQRHEVVLDSLETSRARDRALSQYDELRAELNRQRTWATNGRIALIGNQRLHAYWHWWIDTVSRIWFLETYGGEENAGIPLAFPPLRRFQSQALALLGYEDRVRILEPGVHRFEEVVFTPGVTGRHPEYPSPLLAEYAEWLRGKLRVRDRRARDGRPPLKLFVGRRDARTDRRRVHNEDEVREHLERRGFTCIDAGRLPLKKQVRLFGAADVVVGPHGAALTNLLFCRPGTPVVELLPASGARPLSCYRVAASHVGLPYTRIAVHPVSAGDAGPKRAGINDGMVVDVARLADQLEALGL